jgi:4-azaleucine resistance transporter AzlC
MAPLWPGVAPFGFTFALLARTAGFSLLETQALSAILFAGSSQVAVVTLSLAGSGGLAIVLTVAMLNARHALYGLSLGPLLGARLRPPRLLQAFVLTDESYGVAIRALHDGRGSDRFLFGASASLYLTWNLATFAGSLLGAVLPDPQSIGLDVIFPLSFLALLVPLLRSWRHIVVAVAGGALAMAARAVAPSGVAIVVATVMAAALGVVLERWGQV